MDGNNKNNSRVDPRPPLLQVGCDCNVIAPGCGVQANGVHACSAGNVSARLNVTLESCAWLVGLAMLNHELRAKVRAYNP